MKNSIYSLWFIKGISDKCTLFSLIKHTHTHTHTHTHIHTGTIQVKTRHQTTHTHTHTHTHKTTPKQTNKNKQKNNNRQTKKEGENVQVSHFNIFAVLLSAPLDFTCTALCCWCTVSIIFLQAAELTRPTFLLHDNLKLVFRSKTRAYHY